MTQKANGALKATPHAVPSRRNRDNPCRILPEVYERIRNTLKRPETGGILGADASGKVVAFHFDHTGTTTENMYIPDTAALNQVIEKWFQRGVAFAGFVHAHDKEIPRLSCADKEYAQRVKETCHMESVLMLLYLPETGAFYEYIV